MWRLVIAVFMIQALGTECVFQDIGKPKNPEVELNVHGLLVTSITWVSNLPNNSLGFILADAGFDVWMGNSRGSTYSLKHAFLSTTSKQYWAFSVDELAQYDLPASIDHVVKKTGQKIYYVGHSQGTLIGLISFIAFSTLPKLAQEVKAFFALAPIFYVQHIQSIPFLLLLRLPRPLLRNVNEIQPILRAYDWGSPKENLAHYNQMIPPAYNLSAMKVPTVLWSGLNDVLADPKDVSSLIPQIPKMIYHKILPSFDHLAFILGVNAPQAIYYEIIKMIKETL